MELMFGRHAFVLSLPLTSEHMQRVFLIYLFSTYM